MKQRVFREYLKLLRRLTLIKKKNRLQMLAALLAATLSMALTSPIAAKANEEYNVDTTKESNADTGRIYYLKNSHGDVIGHMDETGTVLTSYAYNACGEQVSAVATNGEQKSPTNRFLYPREQYDETSGLYYLRARHYDVKAGRFTQEDTYLGDGRNLYAYVHSNPLKYVDPTGHATEANADGDTNLLNDEKVHDGSNAVKTYQTYTKVNIATGQVYSGRTSGYSSAVDNVAKRDAYHHMNSRGYGTAVLDKSSSSAEAIRGREQMLINSYGGAQSTGGTSGNAINGISANNPKGSIYMDAARGEFGIFE